MAGNTGARRDVSIGDVAPDFDLEGSMGRVRLADYEPAQNVAIFFMREFG
jgi:hypothetical protein